MHVKITRERLAVLHAASDDPTRYNLNAVRFEADGTLVATNGNILAVSKPGEEAEGIKLDPFQISVEDAKRCSKEAGTGKYAVGITVDEHSTNDVPTSDPDEKDSLVGWGKSGGLKCEKVRCDYPNWENVTNQPKLPEADKPGHHRVGISLAVLEKLVAIGRQASKTKRGEGKCVEFSFPENPDSMLTATIPGEEAEGLTVYLMPMRLK